MDGLYLFLLTRLHPIPTLSSTDVTKTITQLRNTSSKEDSSCAPRGLARNLPCPFSISSSRPSSAAPAVPASSTTAAASAKPAANPFVIRNTGPNRSPASAIPTPASYSGPRPGRPRSQPDGGRPFTGDGSGDFMYPVLHELGLASKPSAISRDDGLSLRAWIASVVRCALPATSPPPRRSATAPSPDGRGRRTPQSARRRVSGKDRLGWIPRASAQPASSTAGSDYRFSHVAEYVLPNGLPLLGSYHPSLRNTNTGRLNRAMFARIFLRAMELCGYSL